VQRLATECSTLEATTSFVSSWVEPIPWRHEGSSEGQNRFLARGGFRPLRSTRIRAVGHCRSRRCWMGRAGRRPRIGGMDRQMLRDWVHVQRTPSRRTQGQLAGRMSLGVEYSLIVKFPGWCPGSEVPGAPRTSELSHLPRPRSRARDRLCASEGRPRRIRPKSSMPSCQRPSRPRPSPSAAFDVA
jgi:hypothetical protein